ncbi:hypothetical protein [Bacillus haynesii]|uniref:hypothetical protein n=1 Tax=Bacillus haynesii TaxID=1925021 RepID=UPI002282F902|nr:hypothetical protein [Bacillus haynesii]MCY7771312.1 hypothetical protein [Bacillus haynesii]MCY9372071.1 hypothetical protein [Bacillus haynesii]MEC0701351.1 hypothetical protein [Bacillus haynesii]MEC0761084.1 hypothetical protein [Bacillus haynesii]MEC0784699.1 hypothetical protein [Bacillus haynesii]
MNGLNKTQPGWKKTQAKIAFEKYGKPETIYFQGHNGLLKLKMEIEIMFTIKYDDEFIDQIASKIADRAIDILMERLDSLNELPHFLTREEAMKVLRCGPTKMSELMSRPDFPVTNAFGKKIPTKLLFKWVERNTRWVEESTNYFD